MKSDYDPDLSLVMILVLTDVSPGYLVFRMGSLYSHLLTVAKIWPLEVGQLSRFHGLNYGKFAPKK